MKIYSSQTVPAHYTASLARLSLLAAKTLATRCNHIGIRSGQALLCVALTLNPSSHQLSAVSGSDGALAQRPWVNMITPWPACLRWGPHHSSLQLQLTTHQGYTGDLTEH